MCFYDTVSNPAMSQPSAIHMFRGIFPCLVTDPFPKMWLDEDRLTKTVENPVSSLIH